MDNRAIVSGLLAGMGAMYVLDPQRGHRRRSIFKDKSFHYVKRGNHYLANATHDLSNRVQGFVAEMQASMKNSNIPDEILEERVRSRLGHACSHPSVIRVRSNNGAITLNGQILKHELHNVLGSIASVRGVKNVVDQLEYHDVNENIPSLQGVGKVSKRFHFFSPGVTLGSLLVGTGSVFLFLLSRNLLSKNTSERRVDIVNRIRNFQFWKHKSKVVA
jgi:hypothetical protein